MSTIKKIVLLIIIICVSFYSSAQYTKLFDFDTTTTGSFPYGSLISDSNFLYGMTREGGSMGKGVIFKIKPDGSGYSKLLDFNTTNGGLPFASLISDGIFFYGTTQYGGTNNGGVIFKIMPDGTGFTKLFDLTNATGKEPHCSLISDGIFLYGMTTWGGLNGVGTVFKIKTDGSQFTKLLDFKDTITGARPYGSLISDGTFLYGMTFTGGINNVGTIFRIKTDGSAFSKLLDFDYFNGASPNGSLIYDGQFLYGMTNEGGLNNFGNIFRIKPDGSEFSNIFNFDNINGLYPYGSLIYDGTFLYGMTTFGGTGPCIGGACGTLFKIKPDGSEFSKLMDFTGTENGKYPFGDLISDGTFLYGMTREGGSYGTGTIFKYALQTGQSQIQNPQYNISITPNPFNNHFTIALPFSQTATITIYNIFGETIQHSTFNIQHSTFNIQHSTFNLSSHPSGVYFLKANINGQSQTFKLIKI